MNNPLVREVISSMATACATANTTKRNSRVSRESGVLMGGYYHTGRYTWGGATHIKHRSPCLAQKSPAVSLYTVQISIVLN